VKIANGDEKMKGISLFVSSGRGPAILRNCLLGAWILVLTFKQNSVYTARNSNEITEIIAGLTVIFFSLYDTYTRKEKNLVWGIPTWLFGGMLLVIGMIFLFYKN
jgi:hypothetical protein